jgi:hypothetical protein
MISARPEGTPLFLLVGKDTLFAVYLDNFHFVFLLFLRAVDRVDAKDKERYCEIDRYMKNTLKYLGTKSRETADGLKEILEECTNED